MPIQSSPMLSPQFGEGVSKKFRRNMSIAGYIGGAALVITGFGINKYLSDTYTQATGKEPKGWMLNTGERYIAIQAHQDKFKKNHAN